MSLYYETAPFLSTSPTSGSLKSRIYGAGPTKSPAKQIFALASETSKWSPVLAEVIERAQLLQSTHKLTPNLALLLVHDLLLTKHGIAAPGSHPLRLTIEKYRARLAAELTRARLRRGFASLEQLRKQVKEGLAQSHAEPRQYEDKASDESNPTWKWPQPRWVRVNTLKTSIEDQLKTTFVGYKIVQNLGEVVRETSSRTEQELIHVDKHIPNLLALPPGTDLSKARAYRDGLVILQDKASCFPGYLLDPDAQDDCLDACAAPGNKTTHLAAILHEKGSQSLRPRTLIHANERDLKRASILDTMLGKAGALKSVHVHKQDFLKFDPTQPPCSSVGVILLDPSCSGSGIVSRDDVFNVTFPCKQSNLQSNSRPKKRKRTNSIPILEDSMAELQEEPPGPASESAELLKMRLSGLSDFQLRLLLHAFNFPKAHKIAYSTCSIFAEENEHVIIKALLHSHESNLGWRILLRNEQVQGMQDWDVRGDQKACEELLKGSDLDAKVIANACIRCEKGTNKGTQGFFVAAFVRDVDSDIVLGEEQEEEWEGFDEA